MKVNTYVTRTKLSEILLVYGSNKFDEIILCIIKKVSMEIVREAAIRVTGQYTINMNIDNRLSRNFSPIFALNIQYNT